MGMHKHPALRLGGPWYLDTGCRDQADLGAVQRACGETHLSLPQDVRVRGLDSPKLPREPVEDVGDLRQGQLLAEAAGRLVP